MMFETTMADNEYTCWCDDAGIVAPKVRVGRRQQHGMRGLYATDTIYPGERILFIPQRCLLSAGTLQAAGQQALINGDVTTTTTSPERWIMGVVEDFRQALMTCSELVALSKQLQYTWRDDDGVALYLVLARQLMLARAAGDDDSSATWERCEGRQRGTEKPVEAELVSNDVATAAPLVPAEPVATLELSGSTSPLVMPAPPEAINENDIDADPLQEPGKTEKNTYIDSIPSFLPHVRMLPAAFPTNPLEWSTAELLRIEGTNCHGYVTRLASQMQNDAHRLQYLLRAYQVWPGRRTACATCRDDGKDKADSVGNVDVRCCYGCRDIRFADLASLVTPASYRWALCNVYSRSTDFSTSAGATTRVIAPLFDMMNNNFSSAVSHGLDTGQQEQGNVAGLSVYNVTDETIEFGEEVCLRYGSFGNEKLLTIYGFCVPDNAFDAVSLYAPLNSTDPLFQLKAGVLQNKCGINHLAPHLLPMPPPPSSKQDGSGSVLPNSLLSVLRITGVETYEGLRAVTVAMNDSDETEDFTVALISVENERNAMAALHQALHSMSRRMALNLISDQNLQAASSLASTIQQQDKDPTRAINVRHAKLLCEAEHQILLAALADVHERLHALDGVYREQQ